jgi:hypothetical protein
VVIGASTEIREVIEQTTDELVLVGVCGGAGTEPEEAG